MPALDIITGQGTAIGAGALAALTPVAGDSFAVRNCPLEKKVQILTAWTDVQVAGEARIRSPRMHDNVQGIRWTTIISDPTPVFPGGVGQRVYSNDVLNVELRGSGVAGDIESVCMLLYYEDLPGAAARLIGEDELMRRAVNIFPVENTLALGTAGGYSGSEAINAEFDQFHAGGQYALVGYLVSAECAAVAWHGADTGNLRVGGPGIETDRTLTKDWFLELTRMFRVPLIPVFSAENKGGLLVDGVQDENGTDTTVTSIFVELAPR